MDQRHVPSLTVSAPRRRGRAGAGGGPRGVVLILHGGAEQSLEPVDQRSLSWRRARFLMRDLQRLHADGLALWLLRYRVKGWNPGVEEHPSPVADARWALGEIGQAHPGMPVVLLGHSMGARTAVAVADHPTVRGVVALAPWFPPGEPVAPLSGKHLIAAHGDRDRITRLGATRAYVARAGEVAASAALTEMPGLGHYLVRGRRLWNAFAAEGVRKLLVA